MPHPLERRRRRRRRQRQHHRVPRPGTGEGLELRADAFGALDHDAPADDASRRGAPPASTSKPMPSSRTSKRHCGCCCTSTQTARRVSVLAHVGQRLLHHVQHLQLRVRRQRQAVAASATRRGEGRSGARTCAAWSAAPARCLRRGCACGSASTARARRHSSRARRRRSRRACSMRAASPERSVAQAAPGSSGRPATGRSNRAARARANCAPARSRLRRARSGAGSRSPPARCKPAPRTASARIPASEELGVEEQVDLAHHALVQAHRHRHHGLEAGLAAMQSAIVSAAFDGDHARRAPMQSGMPQWQSPASTHCSAADMRSVSPAPRASGSAAASRRTSAAPPRRRYHLPRCCAEALRQALSAVAPATNAVTSYSTSRRSPFSSSCAVFSLTLASRPRYI